MLVDERVVGSRGENFHACSSIVHNEIGDRVFSEFSSGEFMRLCEEAIHAKYNR